MISAGEYVFTGGLSFKYYLLWLQAEISSVIIRVGETFLRNFIGDFKIALMISAGLR